MPAKKKKNPVKRPSKKVSKKTSQRRAPKKAKKKKLSAPSPPSIAPPPQGDGRFELRIILITVALIAALIAFKGLKERHNPAQIATAARQLRLEYGVNQFAFDKHRIVIRIEQTIARNHRVWVDLLPTGNFMPAKLGANDYTVLDYNYGDDQTAIYKRGLWEGQLKQVLKEKQKK